MLFQIEAQDNNTFRMVKKKSRQKWLVKKSKFVKKKKPPRAQIFRYFRIESRNNNGIKGQLIKPYADFG